MIMGVFKRKPNVSETSANKRSRTFDKELQCQRLNSFKQPAQDTIFPAEANANFEPISVTEDTNNEINIRDLTWNLSIMDLSDTSIRRYQFQRLSRSFHGIYYTKKQGIKIILLLETCFRNDSIRKI